MAVLEQPRAVNRALGLQPGDVLSPVGFERRYGASRHLKKAEPIDGIGSFIAAFARLG